VVEAAPVEKPAAAPAQKPVAVAARTNGIRHFQRSAPRGKSLVPLLGFSLAGAFLFAFAVFWRLNAGAEQGQNANDQAVSYLAGILGVICIFFAAYLVLDRFAGEDD
jgi:hypothetical protein